MKPRLHIKDMIILLIAALPYAYLAHIYDALPATVPTHFGISGKADGFGSKTGMWGTTSILAVMSLLLFLLMRFLPLIDPKKTAKYSANLFDRIALAVVILSCVINLLILNAAQTGTFKLTPVFPVIMGLFFAFIGNVMYNIKPNYFAGIRTPWTLENEETWRRTHQFGGKLWFIGGLVIAAVSLLLHGPMALYFMQAGLLVLALTPVIYSYTTYKAIKKRENP